MKKEVKTNHKINKFNIFGTIFSIVCLLGIVVTITVVSVSKIKKSAYGHYDDEEYKDDTIRLNQLLNKCNDDTYYVFIYTKDCNSCDRLEKTVLEYIDKGPRRLYLLNGDKYQSQLLEIDYQTMTYKANYEVDDYTDLRVRDYPCLLIIQNKEVTAHVLGYTSIKNQLIMR